MKLFAVRHQDDKTKPTPPFFSSKQKAKELRDANGKGFVITPGPDHRKYKS